MRSERLIKALPTLLILAVSLLGVGLMVYATRWGPTVYSDGVVYLLSADSLAKGDGLGITWGSGRFHALDGFPPLYSLVVALLETMGLSMVSAARLVSVAGFGALIGAMGVLGMRATHSVGVGLSVCLLLVTSPLLLAQFANAGSEGVFYLTGLSGLVLLLVAEESGRRGVWALAAVLLGLAFLSRYVGVSLILTASLFTAFAAGWPSRGRLWKGARVAAIAIGMMLPWLLWTHSTSGTLGGKTPHVLGNLWAESEPLRAGLIDITWKWLPLLGGIQASYRVRGIVLLVALLSLIGILIACVAAARRPPGELTGVVPLARWGAVLLLWGVLYALVHAVAFLTAYPTPDISLRILTPLNLSGAMAALGVAWLVPKVSRPRSPLVALPLVALLLLVIPNARQSIQLANSLNREGEGFTSRTWQDSKLIAAVRQLPEGTPIITNAPDAIIFLTGRPTYWIPEIMRGLESPEFSTFGEHPERSEEERAFRERGGVLVFAPGIESQLQTIYRERTRDRLESMTHGLRVLWWNGPDQAIYSYPEVGGP
jgi:4-amino-4-deoxy-L-arabinose transferase-like glycosyltransferase